MRFRDKRVPFFARHRLDSGVTVYRPARPAATINKHSGISGIAQHTQDVAVFQFAPDDLSLRRAGMNAPRKQDAGPTELVHGDRRGTGSLERVEESSQGLL